jgi:Nod factor-specific ABC transporter NodJ protein
MNILGWYPIFLREMLLFKRKLLKLGYLLSAMIIPIIYLIVFGLGLGRSVRFSSQDYLSFLIPGLVAMSSMTNSYNWIANSVNLGRLYFKTFQVLLLSPLPFFHIVLGEVFSGIIKGLFAATLIIIVGFLTLHYNFITFPFIIALFLNCFLFASLGFTVGMISKGHEETATYSNFFILPMAFFCGTFFPIERIPSFLKPIIYVLPLTHTNILIRKEFFDAESFISLFVLIFYSTLCFVWGMKLMKNYSE